MDQVKFVENSLQKILLGPFLNALTHLFVIPGRLSNILSS